MADQTPSPTPTPASALDAAATLGGGQTQETQSPSPSPAPAAAPAPATESATSQEATPSPTAIDIGAPAQAAATAPAAAPEEPLSDEQYALAARLPNEGGDGEYVPNGDDLNAIVKSAREAGLSPQQTATLLRDLDQSRSTRDEAARQAEADENSAWLAEGKQKAIEMFGFDGLKKAASVVQRYAEPGSLFFELVKSGLGNDPGFIRMCRDFAVHGGASDTAPGATGGTPPTQPYSWKDSWAKSAVSKPVNPNPNK